MQDNSCGNIDLYKIIKVLCRLVLLSCFSSFVFNNGLTQISKQEVYFEEASQQMHFSHAANSFFLSFSDTQTDPHCLMGFFGGFVLFCFVFSWDAV